MSRRVKIDWQEDERTFKKLYDREKNPRIRLRLQAMWEIRQGRPVPEVASMTGASIPAIHRWLKKYREEGLAGLGHAGADILNDNEVPFVSLSDEERLRRENITLRRQLEETQTLLATGQDQGVVVVPTTYQLEAKENFRDGLRRVVTDEVEQIMVALQEPLSGVEGETAVHTARKGFKKVRAVLQLVRDEIGYPIYKSEMRFFREQAQQLGSLRESSVHIAALDALMVRFVDDITLQEVAELRNYLEANLEATRQAAEKNDVVAVMLQELEKAQSRLKHLPIERSGFKAVSAGLRRTYSRGRDGMLRAYAQPTAAHFHEWRKMVKGLWYHSRLLAHLWPSYFGALVQELAHVAEQLGKHHDLMGLRHTIYMHPDWVSNQALLKKLNGFIEQYCQEIETAVLPTAERIYWELPSDFVTRLAGYWKIHRNR